MLKNILTKDLSAYAPVVLRLGLAAVYVWFGVSQLMDPAAWGGLVPGWATSLSGMDAPTFVRVNGVFEVVAATLLVLGVYVRVVAALLAGHLFVIAQSLGFNDIGVRDFGLACSTLALAMFGDHAFCLLSLKKK